MSPETVLSKFCHEKINKRTTKRGPWMAATVITERLSWRQRTFTGRR